MSKRKIITLCGSTRFREQFNDASFWLTMHGHVVLSPGVFLHSEDGPAIRDIILARKAELDELHKYKIDMSDAIMVIDVNGYAGESTRSEIEYAIRKGNTVYSYTQSKAASKDLLILIHCDPDRIESWLTQKQNTTATTPASVATANHHARTYNTHAVPVTAPPAPSFHLAAEDGLVALPSDNAAVCAHSSMATAAPQAVPPSSSSAYATANMCRQCLHHANCHYIDEEKYGDTHCTACANAKCRKLADFIEPENGIEVKTG